MKNQEEFKKELKKVMKELKVLVNIYETTYGESENIEDDPIERLYKDIYGAKDLTELVYDEYKQYEFVPEHKLQGISHTFMFDNGYGASVVKTKMTYGGDEDLFELAVIKKNGDDFDLCYDTPITNDVIGWLSNDDVLETLEKIKNL